MHNIKESVQAYKHKENKNNKEQVETLIEHC
jgi:hypothetical protein